MERRCPKYFEIDELNNWLEITKDQRAWKKIDEVKILSE